METNLEVSLDITRNVLERKRDELKSLTTFLQETPDLDDQVVVLLAEICNITKGEIERIEKIVDGLEQQIHIFGKLGLPKELETVHKNDYPDNQQPGNI
jgi:hypothetical protein